MREAFRLNKHLLLDRLAERGETMDVAFIWLDDSLHDSEEVERKVEKLLHRMGERL